MSETTFRVVVVGAGSIGERHIRCFGATGRVAVSFFEPQAQVRAQIAERYPATQALNTFEQALSEPFDAAVIATPASVHVAQATALVHRGAHALIEKPLSVTTTGVAELMRLANERERTVGVAYVYRAHPVLQEMRDAIHSGRFGRPVELVAVCGQHFPFYRPAYLQTYYTRHETGGGAVQDALTHIVNAGEWLVGPVTRVVADVAHCVLEGANVEDTVHVLARQGEVLASYSLNQHQAPNESTLTVICERGTARFEMHGCRWRECTTPGGEWIDHPHQPLERDELFTRQANAFLDAIASKSPPVCDLAEGMQTLKVNRAILASMMSGRWESLNGESA